MYFRSDESILKSIQRLCIYVEESQEQSAVISTVSCPPTLFS